MSYATVYLVRVRTAELEKSISPIVTLPLSLNVVERTRATKTRASDNASKVIAARPMKPPAMYVAQ